MPMIVQDYIYYLINLYDKHKIPSRAQQFEDKLLKETDTEALKTLHYNFSALDIEMIRYMQRAEALCKQKKNATHAWSPTLTRVGGRVSY